MSDFPRIGLATNRRVYSNEPLPVWVLERDINIDGNFKTWKLQVTVEGKTSTVMVKGHQTFDIMSLAEVAFNYDLDFSAKSVIARGLNSFQVAIDIVATSVEDTPVSTPTIQIFVMRSKWNSKAAGGVSFYDFWVKNKIFMTFKKVRYVVPESPEYLTWYNVNQATGADKFNLKCKIYYVDGSIGVVDKGEVLKLAQIACGLDQLGIKGEKDIDSYEIWLEDKNGGIASEKITFIVDYTLYQRKKFVVFRNSLGGFDTLLFTGEGSSTYGVSGTRAIEQKYGALKLKKEGINVSRVSKIGSGIMPSGEVPYLAHEFLSTDKIYLIEDGALSEMILEDGNFEYQDKVTGSVSFDITLTAADISGTILPMSVAPPSSPSSEVTILTHNHDNLYYRKEVVDIEMGKRALNTTVAALSADFIIQQQVIATKADKVHNHKATEVVFEDGQTFEEKLKSGQLKGKDGVAVDGKEVEIRCTDDYVQWRYTGGTSWINLISIAALTGKSAKEILIQKSGNVIQWKHDGDQAWTNLVYLSEIKGEDGTTPAIGGNGNWFIKDVDTGVKAQGKDGRSLEIRKGQTHIQWRVAGDDTWTNLIQIDELSSYVTVPDLKADTAAKYDEARVAFYAAGKNYFGVNYKWFSVRMVAGAKKFLPIGINYISSDDNGINCFDPITEQYIQLKTWEQLRGKKGDSVSILENGHWALNGVDTGMKAEGDPGADGLSAYKIALNNGFDGTEQQWLESLKGRPGTNGLGYLAISNSGQNVPAVGAVARINIPYSSAYQHGTRIRAASVTTPATAWFEGVITESDGNSQMVAVDVAEGVGTNVSAWAISVAGIPGKNGIGINGKSAYEIEKANGTFSGTEAEYANSFKALREHPQNKETHISKEEREFWNSIATPLIINELPLNVLLNSNKRYINVLGFSALTSNNSGGTDMSQGAEIHYQLIAEINFRLVSAGRADKVANFNISVTGSTYAGSGVQSCVISKNFDEIGLLFSTKASQQIRPDEKYLPRSEFNILSTYIDKTATALETNSYLEVVIRRVYRESSLRDGSKKSFSDSFLEYDYANRKYGYEAMSTNLDIAFCNVVDPLGGKINDMRVANPIFNALAAADKDTLIKIIQWLIDSKVDNKLKPNSVLVGSSSGVAQEEEMIDYVDPNLANPTQIHPVGFAVRLNTGFEIAYLHNIFRSIPIAIHTAGVTQIYAPNPARKILVKDAYLLVVSRNSGSVPPSNIRLDLSVNSDGSAPFSTVDFPPNLPANGVVSMSIPATTIDLDRGLFFKTAGFTGYSLQSTVVVIINALYL